MQVWMTRHRRLAWGLTCGVMIFFNCCDFPVYSLTAGRSPAITALSCWNTAVAAWLSGVLLAGLFPDRQGTGRAVLLTVLLMLAGLGCRFLLEYGEISNVYNFTWPNVMLHLLVYGGLCLLSRLWAVKRAEAEKSA